MNSIVDVFVELGHRLYLFGGDEVTRGIVTRAHSTNSWFGEKDICRSIRSISSEMLRRDRLEVWLAEYNVPVTAPKRVLVVMAGNIPLVGFFDLLCVVVAGHRCVVKPSTKDCVLIEYIIGLLREIDASIMIEIYDGASSVDAVIATGGDNAKRVFRARYADIPSLLRGSRQSVAVLSGDESGEQLTGLSDDIFAYSGLGCRNVTMIFIPRGYNLLIPQYAVNNKYVNNYVQSKAILAMTNENFIDTGNALLLEQQGLPNALSVISYSYYDNIKDVEQWLDTHDDKLQCVVSESVKHSRCVGFGTAQSPSLMDYPDDVDVMMFLQKL